MVSSLTFWTPLPGQVKPCLMWIWPILSPQFVGFRNFSFSWFQSCKQRDWKTTNDWKVFAKMCFYLFLIWTFETFGNLRCWEFVGMCQINQFDWFQLSWLNRQAYQPTWPETHQEIKISILTFNFFVVILLSFRPSFHGHSDQGVRNRWVELEVRRLG